MRTLSTLLIVLGLVLAMAFAGQAALANSLGIPDSEYNALVALYNSAGGPNWQRSDNWLTANGSWYGVSVSEGHVVQLSLQNNLLIGSLPPELGDLTSLQYLNLQGNQLTGVIPSTLAGLSQLQYGSTISYNGLWTTDATLSAFLASKFPNWDLTQTVAPTNVTARGSGTVTVSWTPISYSKDPGYYEVGVSSTAGGPYFFSASRRTSHKGISSLTITGISPDRPQYFVVRTVTLAHSYNQLILTSGYSNEALANALGIPDPEFAALVALYNSTGGPNWLHSDYWLRDSNAWYGVAVSGGHVVQLNLAGNLLAGSIPPEMGNLTYLRNLNLRSNQLVGAIPSSFANLTQLQPSYSSLSYNCLWNTDSALGTLLASKFPSWDTTQTVAPTNVTARGVGTITASWTPIAYAADSGYYEVGVSSAKGGPYTFASTRRTSSKYANSLVVTGLSADRPQYIVVRTVTLASYDNPIDLTSGLSGEALANPLNIPDSEFAALVALYNSTGGPNWQYNNSWLKDTGGWYGVTVSGGHVTQLSLPNNLLIGSIPPEIGNLTYLQTLNLRGNGLVGAIPASLANLTQLQTMANTSLSYNSLWNADSALGSFLGTKFPAWDNTQTIAPTNVTAQGSGTVTVSWTPIKYSGDSGYYEVGVSSAAGGPYVFMSTRRTTNKLASSLPVYGLSSDSPHFFAVRTTTMPNGYNMQTLTSDPSSEATEWVFTKIRADGLPTALAGGIVTAVFPDGFYVESPDRSFGIRAVASGTTVTRGKIDIRGTLSTDQTTGERYIDVSSALQSGGGSVVPLALSNASLGGGPWYYNSRSGAGQNGIDGATGLNNIGLLVRVFGRITERDPASPSMWFKIDDGSNAYVKCLVPAGVTIDPAWTYVGVTGISSCESYGGELYRLLRVRAQDDITAF